MHWTYSKFDESNGKFLSPDDLFASPDLVEFILSYGQDGLDALPDLADEDGQIRQLIQELLAAGLVEQDDDSGALRPTPRLLRGMQHRAFLDIFRGLRPGVRDAHDAPEPGARGERAEGARPYQFGDPLADLALNETLRNAIRRRAAETVQRRAPAPPGDRPKPTTGPQRIRPASSAIPAVLPLRLRDDDFEVHNAESRTDAALCVLIDLSGSMMRYGRHIAAKRVALGMRALLRERFPLDTIDFVGFASTAAPLHESEVALAMPRPITTREWDVRVRVPLDQAEMTHPHFTNLHHALRVARQRLARRGAANKQLFIITDGEPTAHLTPAFGDAISPDPAEVILNLIYPPAEASRNATLAEAWRCAQEGVRIASFALIEEYHGMDWVGFIDQLTRLTRGAAFYCTAGDLGSTIMESYLTGKRQKRPLG